MFAKKKLKTHKNRPVLGLNHRNADAASVSTNHRGVDVGSVYRNNTSGGIVCRSVSMLKADILNITYDCYSQHNNAKMATL